MRNITIDRERRKVAPSTTVDVEKQVSKENEKTKRIRVCREATCTRPNQRPWIRQAPARKTVNQ